MNGNKQLRAIKQLCNQNDVLFAFNEANGHFQIKGDLLVNYYPLSKNSTAYIAGMTSSKKNVTAKQAFSMVFSCPTHGNTTKRKKSYRKERERLIKIKPNCHWCDKELTLEASTLDHIIPLSKGGLNNRNNYALSCFECNSKRGDSMPEVGIDQIPEGQE